MSQLVAFQGMVRIEKKTKIRQLTAVVKGLRIYNWDCGRGGAGTFNTHTVNVGSFLNQSRCGSSA